MTSTFSSSMTTTGYGSRRVPNPLTTSTGAGSYGRSGRLSSTAIRCRHGTLHVRAGIPCSIPDLIEMVAINPDTLSLLALSRYVEFARLNGQNAQRWEHALWIKLGYPVVRWRHGFPRYPVSAARRLSFGHYRAPDSDWHAHWPRVSRIESSLSARRCCIRAGSLGECTGANCAAVCTRRRYESASALVPLRTKRVPDMRSCQARRSWSSRATA